MTVEPKPTGAFTDETGTLRCRATSARCLGHRQALELVAKARTRAVQADAVHCSLCCAWHYHIVGRMQGGRPRRQGRQVRRWRS